MTQSVQTVKFADLSSVAAISWGGAFLEWLDFYTYAVYATVVASVFFPSHDPIASLLASFAALAIGFLFRPLGALIFGHIGDRFGRKISFVTAMSMMLAGTLGIGLLPGYASIGIIASISVFLLRIIQGFALGGGYGSAIVYLGEFVPEKRRGLITGLLFTTPAAGLAVAGNLLAYLQSIFGKAGLISFAWRYGFIIAGVIVFIIALIMYLFYKDTPIFSSLRTLRRITGAPIKEVFANKRYVYLVLLGWIGVIGAHGPIWYTNQLYDTYFLQFHGWSPGDANYVLSLATYAALWTYLFFGWLSDKIGRRPILLIGIFGNALLFPLIFYLLGPFADAKNFTAVFLFFIVMTYFNGIGYSGAMSAFLLELFPARIRTTAVAFTYNMGYGITGGLTPLIITAIYSYIKNLVLAITLYSTLVPIIMGLFYLLRGWETLGTRIWEEFDAGKFMKQPLIVSSNTPIIKLASELINSGNRVSVVIDNDGKYKGIAGERAVLKALASGLSLNTEVDKITINAEPLHIKSPVVDAIGIMNKYNIRSVAIIDDAGKPVGLLDARELLNEKTVMNSLVKKPVIHRMPARELVSRKPIVIQAGNSLKEAIKLMSENNMGLLPVVNKNGELIGVISERDITAAISNKANLDSPVQDYMKTNPITLGYNASVKDAIDIMNSKGIRHVIITNDQKQIVGVISIRDLIKLA